MCVTHPGTHQVLAGRRLRGVELLLRHAQLDATVALDALRSGVASKGGGAASVGRGGKVLVSTSGARTRTSRARCSVVHRAGEAGLRARARDRVAARSNRARLDESMRSARGGWGDRVGTYRPEERETRAGARSAEGRWSVARVAILFYRRGTRGWVGAEAKARLGRTLEKTTTRLDDELGACADACGDTRALVTSVDWPRKSFGSR